MPVQAQQSNQIDRKEQHDAPHADGLISEEAAQRVHVRGGALDQLAGLSVVVVGKGQSLDVVE